MSAVAPHQRTADQRIDAALGAKSTAKFFEEVGWIEALKRKPPAGRA